MVRLAMLKLVHDAYERGGPVDAGPVEAWLAPLRTVRL